MLTYQSSGYKTSMGDPITQSCKNKFLLQKLSENTGEYIAQRYLLLVAAKSFDFLKEIVFVLRQNTTIMQQ